AFPYAFTWDTTGVLNGSHTLTAVARDAAGNTSTSLPVSVTVSNPDTLPPSLPTGLTATADSASQITLAWSPAADNVGVTGYQVFRNGVQTGIASGNSYQDTGLSPVTVYTYTVAAFDAAGNTASAAVTVTVNNDLTPPVLSGATASALSVDTATISWTTDELADSQVEYGLSTGYGSASVLDASRVTAHTVTLNGLTAGTL